jgi:hypothetical protein
VRRPAPTHHESILSRRCAHHETLQSLTGGRGFPGEEASEIPKGRIDLAPRNEGLRQLDTPQATHDYVTRPCYRVVWGLLSSLKSPSSVGYRCFVESSREVGSIGGPKLRN